MIRQTNRYTRSVVSVCVSSRVVRMQVTVLPELERTGDGSSLWIFWLY